MEQKEIAKRNQLIAEWMCYPYPITPEFNVNWHSLMPVVEKIIKEANVAFHVFPPFGGETFTCRFGMGKNWEGDTMIEAVWMSVSEYVLSLGK
jgi:hypothetical protein